MLQSFHIENMAIIAALDVDLTEGLLAVTGETGAGKSVMIDSLLFLLGGKPRRDLLRHGAARGLVSAVFSDVGEPAIAYLREVGLLAEAEAPEELLLQRTLDENGKTAARLNGRVLSQAMLRELSKYLVSIHGQNDNQLFMQPTIQLAMLDGAAALDGMLDTYRELYQKRSTLLRQKSDLTRDSAEKMRLCDILRFQITEIDAAKLKVGEEEALLARRTKLQYAEKIAKGTAFAYHVLLGSEKASAALILERAAAALSSISGAVPEAEELAARLKSIGYEVQDIANTARDFGDEVEGDPTEALNKIEARLDTVSKLQRKYGAEIADILAFRAEAAQKLQQIDNADEALAALERDIKITEQELYRLAADVHTARVAAAKLLDGRIAEELAFLDMPAVRFEIAVRDTGILTADGTDEVTFLISTNKGEALMPLARVASGGELARVTLAMRSVLNDRDGVGMAVFDEVDTGISGKTSRKIGIKLAEMGKKMQVLCVTHSAQIASLATTHYKISKQEHDGRTVATVLPLDEAGRVSEVARILGGIDVTETTRRAAAEMIGEGVALR
ncbi:MAG: DNA repair protein RecN [Ruminococcaceae bacterium]|nr:DNA repair protein RecN [Oscillospiraceae bacterium]